MGELWHDHLALAGKTAAMALPLSLVDSPAFSKRMFWNWTHCTSWDDDLSGVHRTKHVHYPTLSPIVEDVCKEYGVRFSSHPTFWVGVVSHYRWLRHIGRT